MSWNKAGLLLLYPALIVTMTVISWGLATKMLNEQYEDTAQLISIKRVKIMWIIIILTIIVIITFAGSIAEMDSN